MSFDNKASMSALGPSDDRASPRSQELNRRFRRPDAPTTPPTKHRPSVQQQQQQQQQNTLPKVLSQIAKVQQQSPPAGQAEPKPKHSVDYSNGVSTLSPSTQDERIVEQQSESRHSSAPYQQMQTPIQRPPIISTSDHSSVGLNLLQEQVRRLALRKGFTLNIMVVGRSGLGKSTLINTLFRSSVLPRGFDQDLSTPGKTTEIRTTETTIQENGVRLKLTVTDTPGFGDRIDNTNCWEPAVRYINEQYEKYLLEEQSPSRTRWIPDTRIHCCLYFISPTGHGLRPLDLEVLRRLHRVVNVIPVIAKADSLTLEEREEFKRNIRADLALNQIETYPMAKYDHEEDFEVNQSYRNTTPFAVVGSEQSHQAMGRLVLGRQNKWGLVQIENPMHCEFHHLRDLLIRSRMQDLIELTSSIHYEAFRRHRLLETNGNLLDLSSLNESQI